MNNQVRPAGPPPARFRGAAAPAHETPVDDASGLSLFEDPIDPERGYDPYDTAARPRDIWRLKPKRA